MKLRCFLILIVGLFCLSPHFWAQTYIVTDLGWDGSGPGGGAFHSFINNVGQVAGCGNYYTYGNCHIYLYNGGGAAPIDLGSLGAYPEGPSGINNSGQVVGDSSTLSGASHAFLYSDGQMMDLGTLPGGSSSAATGINNRGQIVGSSDVSGGAVHAFLYTIKTGTMTDLGPVIAGASAINDSGNIVGDLTAHNGLTHAFLYIHSSKTLIDLGALISGGSVNSYAYRINDSNQVIIGSDIGGYLYSYTDGQIISIPPFPGGSPSNISVQGMNNKGDVAGDWTVCCPFDAFLYSGGTTSNLNAFGLSIQALAAWDVNDAEQIPVWAGEEYILTPTSSPCTSTGYVCGCELDTYKTVPAFYNGPNPSMSCTNDGRSPFGIEYECPEYVNRFYAEGKGVDTLNWHANGSQYYSMAAQFGLMADPPTCKTYPQTPCASNTLPEPDDIVSFCDFAEGVCGKPGASYPGHVAIVESVTPNGTGATVTFIEQNYGEQVRSKVNVTKNSDGTYTMAPRNDGKLRAYGWLRLP